MEQYLLINFLEMSKGGRNMEQYLHFKNDFYNICSKKGEEIAITYYKVTERTEECSFLELKQRVDNLIHAYESLGIIRGDRVAVLIPLCPNAYIDILALACMGCTSVVLDINLNNEELKHVLDNADVSLCITTQKIYTEKFNNIDLPVVDCFDNCDWLSKKEIVHAIDPDYDAIAILYSSGTTSRAKGVVIGYEQEMKAMDRLLEVVGTPNIRYLMLFPNSHVSGFTDFLVLLLRGGQLATMEEASATQLMRGFQLYKPNTFGMVPKVWETFKNKIEDEIRKKGDKKSKQIFELINICGSIRAKTGVNLGRKIFKSINEQVFGGNLVQVHSGGGKSNPEVMRFFYNLGYDIFDFYASTEANIPISVTDGKKYMKSVGNVHSNPNVAIRIWNPDERGIGEIQVKSNTLMRGYFRDQKATSEAFEGEYFKTGDYGIIKNDELYIKGRLKESIFLNNGEKVSPDDIECLMNSFIDQPVEYAVFGVKEESGYEHICLCVQAKDGSLDEYFYEINKKLPMNYRFKEIVYFDELPKTSVGKVKRYKLQEMYKQGKPAVDISRIKEDEKKVYHIEKKSIQEIVSNLIGVEEIGVNDKLISDLSMDSIQIFELCVAIDSAYGVNISPMLNEDITVGQIGKLVDSSIGDSEDYSIYPVERKEKDWRFFEKFYRWTIKNYDFSFEGIEYLDESENYIFAPNHESHFDGMWVMCCLPEKIRSRICSMAADYLFESNIYKRGRVIMGAIPVHRTGNSSGAMKRIYELLKSKKKSLIIHPEGTRTRNGLMGDFKDGAAELSIKTGIKIVPVAICGSYDIFPYNRKIPKMGKRKDGSKYSLKILFGEPKDPSNYKNAKELTAEINHAVRTMKEA